MNEFREGPQLGIWFWGAGSIIAEAALAWWFLRAKRRNGNGKPRRSSPRCCSAPWLFVVVLFGLSDGSGIDELRGLLLPSSQGGRVNWR